MSDVDLQFVDEVIDRLGHKPSATIPILQALQEHYRYLPEEALWRVCELTEITPAEITGVSTFYTQFRHRPAGRHMIRVCVGTACHVAGAQMVADAFCRHLHIPEGDDTDADKQFTVEKVACLGCCTLAPVVQIDKLTYGHLGPEMVGQAIEDFLQQAAASEGGEGAPVRAAGPGVGEVRISVDSADMARGSKQVYDALRAAVAEIDAPARVKTVGSMGMAWLTPMVEIVTPDGAAHRYAGVRPDDARDLVFRHFRPGLVRRVCHAASGWVNRLLTDEAWSGVERYAFDVRDPHVAPVVDPQVRVTTEYAGELDPLNIDEYEARGGFEALRRAVTDQTPEEVLEAIESSGLRGRGGAGFPTARKWRAVRDADDPQRYVVCNADEGDPGAFMDRMLLECYPYRILEGIAIAARVVGAHKGHLYIRHEYPLAIDRVRDAIATMKERGYLGGGILGTGFSLELEIMEGAGAFVCGEETALLASIEGRRGMPRFRPPYPAERGLWGKPTLVNNVETYASVPWILREGGPRFAGLGTDLSKGTKAFALAGKVERGGLIEVPMGITIRQIVDEIGGGVPEGRTLKAVQIGGPSGGCIPADLADTPVDYEDLTRLGAMMGSGGLVVLDDSDCMVDITRYFLEFTQDQSCGKCTFCRVGTRRMLEILNAVCEGRAKHGDLEELEHLCHQVKAGSLCGLGQTAPNPVLSTLQYFRPEYEAHLEGRCPAGVCKSLIRFVVTDECIGCTRCAQHCPADAIEARPYEAHEVDQEACVQCGTCVNVCPVDAILIESPGHAAAGAAPAETLNTDTETKA